MTENICYQTRYFPCELNNPVGGQIVWSHIVLWDVLEKFWSTK
jgi:hypothetical protein